MKFLKGYHLRIGQITSDNQVPKGISQSKNNG